MYKLNTVKVLAGLAAGILGFTSAGDAATSAYTLGPSGWSASGGSFVVGFEFSTTTAISITHMGIADWYNDGISGTPEVGIWTNTGTLLATVTIPSGAGADLVETQTVPDVTYYFEQLTSPLTLAAGNYVIANQHTQVAGSQVFGYNGVVNFAPDITWVKGLAENNGGATLAFPNDITYTGGTAYIGPQFKYNVVPEPTSALAGLLIGAGLLRRRRLV